jgi:hypothetical protein
MPAKAIIPDNKYDFFIKILLFLSIISTSISLKKKSLKKQGFKSKNQGDRI